MNPQIRTSVKATYDFLKFEDPRPSQHDLEQAVAGLENHLTIMVRKMELIGAGERIKFTKTNTTLAIDNVNGRWVANATYFV